MALEDAEDEMWKLGWFFIDTAGNKNGPYDGPDGAKKVAATYPQASLPRRNPSAPIAHIVALLTRDDFVPDPE